MADSQTQTALLRDARDGYTQAGYWCDLIVLRRMRNTAGTVAAVLPQGWLVYAEGGVGMYFVVHRSRPVLTQPTCS